MIAINMMIATSKPAAAPIIFIAKSDIAKIPVIMSKLYLVFALCVNL